MTQEHKDLLLKDLCMRLPYGVKAEILNEENERKQVVVSYGNICYIPELGNWWWKECKPYLFPLSSMTEEQYDQLYIDSRVKNDSVDILDALANDMDAIEYLLKNRFDIFGLIPMGLAIDATGLNIY